MSSSVDYRRKCALIIGINDYISYPLKYCINDAEDINEVLERIDFETTLILNCNMQKFYAAIDQFVEMIDENDLVLVYFAGHGKQIDEKNYLIPSDYDYNHRGYERDYIADHAINIEYITTKIDRQKCPVTIYLFDCCRNQVRHRSQVMNDGLGAMAAPLQTLIVYSCAPGKSVLDETSNNRNGSFIENLLKYIEKADKDIEEIMKRVANDVNSQTRGVQLPYRTSSLTKNVYLVKSDDDQNSKFYSNDYSIRCKGRACAHCHRCRDWYWHFVNGKMRHTKRSNARCILMDTAYYDDEDNYKDSDFHVVCQCENNKKI